MSSAETREAEELEDEFSHSSDVEEDTPEASEPATKEQKASAIVGKVPKGKDFWSRVDKFISKLMLQHGNSLKTPEWKRYMDTSSLVICSDSCYQLSFADRHSRHFSLCHQQW